MKNIPPALVLILLPFFSMGQSFELAANEAFMITRMVNKYHVQPRPVDHAFSASVFSAMLNTADDDRLYFTTADITRLGAWRTKLDEEIKQRKTGFLTLFTAIYRQRLKQADSIIGIVSKKPFDFYLTEKFTVAEDTSYPGSVAAMQAKLYKKIKADALEELTDDGPANFKTFSAQKQQRYTDSTLAVLPKKGAATLKRKIAHVLQSPEGLTRYTSNIYCEAIASAFDPHTEFFPPEEKESFESVLGKQPFQFGFRLEPDKNGGVLVENLQPGSPAFKSGKLNKGDKFMSMQWEGREPIDLADISLREFEQLIVESGHEKVLFTVKKIDGTMVQAPLQKEPAVGGDDDKVKSFILKGGNTIGYIYLPAFYEDWETGNDGLNGCANDVGREILKLKKENINGLILDLRYNGGGSVAEATALAGIFVGAGPMAQEKDKEGKPRAIKNFNNGTVFDGPLAVLVNGESASASELVAGTLQDYHRAIIIGAPTYGKATMQVVLPMDTTVTPTNVSQLQTEDNLKVTVSKLYRVTGASAQFTGVQPDIVLPDILDVYITKEADDPTALQPDMVTPNKYYTPLPPLPLKTLAQSVQNEIDTGRYFNAVRKLIAYSKQRKAEKDISLNIKDVLADAGKNNPADDAVLVAGLASKKFTVQNNTYETARLQADANLAAFNEDFIRHVAADAYISVAYEVLNKLKSQ